MMAYKLPTVFQDKIRLDAAKADVMSEPVVDLDEYKALKKELQQTRTACENFIKRQRTGN